MRDEGASPAEALSWAQYNENGFDKAYQFGDTVFAKAGEAGFGDISDPEIVARLNESQKAGLATVLEDAYDEAFGSQRYGIVLGLIPASNGEPSSTFSGYYTPDSVSAFGSEDGYRLRAGAVLSTAVDSGQAILDSTIESLGATNVKWGFTALTFAMGGPLKASFGLAFDHLAGNMVQTLRSDYLEKPLSGLAATYVFGAQTESEYGTVKPASDSAASVATTFLLSALGAVSGYKAAETIIGKVTGYRAKKAAINAELDARRALAIRHRQNVDSEAGYQPTAPEPYNRLNHYGRTPTAADRKALGAGKGEVVDHDPPLVKRYYDGDPVTGEKPGLNMTDAERRASAQNRDRMKLQPSTDSNVQGAEMSRYSRQKRKELGL